jgi:hypothetical protein
MLTSEQKTVHIIVETENDDRFSDHFHVAELLHML